MFKVFRRKGRLFTGLHIAIGIALVFSLISLFNLFHGIQLQITDNLFQAANLNKSTDAKDIIIVSIDDKSLEQLGYYSSWPRSYHARIVDTLAGAEARVIVFDVLFSEPSPDDEKLAESMKKAGNVILPFVHTSLPGDSNTNGQTILLEKTIMPLGVLEDSAAAIGHAIVFPDEDGIIRKLPLLIQNGEKSEPSIALATLSEYLRRPQVIESPIKDNTLSFAGRNIPLDAANCMIINYSNDVAAPLHFREIPYVDVLQGPTSLDIFQDKIVVIGATATGISDKFWTPLGRLMNGVELHVNAMQTILSGNFLKATSPIVDILLIIVLVFICSLAVIHFRVLWAALSVVFLCAIYFLISLFLFDKGIIMNMLHPPLAIIGSFVGMNIYSVIHERNEKIEVTNTFGRYISPLVVNKILKASKEDNLRLGGEDHEITVLFADAKHFTSISENIRSETVFDLLNVYMNIIIENVLKYNGIVNQFGGDSVLAVWNTPLESSEHALLATRAAIDTQRAIAELHEREGYLLNAEFGIGINTGTAMVGNMGSKDCLEYTVIGDAVNIASRLAGAAPGGKIWVGAETYLRIKDRIAAKQLDPVTVKGRHEPVLTYEISDIQNCQIENVEYLEDILKDSVTNHEARV